MAATQLSALGTLLPHLGASVLVSLPSPLLLELLSQPGLHQYPPAQVSRECVAIVIFFFFLSFTPRDGIVYTKYTESLLSSKVMTVNI